MVGVGHVDGEGKARWNGPIASPGICAWIWVMAYGIRVLSRRSVFWRASVFRSILLGLVENLDGLSFDATQQHDARLLDTPPPPACCVYNETLPVDFGVEMGGKAGYESVFEDYYAAEGSGRESGESFTLLAIHSATK